LEPLSQDWSWLETVVGPVEEDFVAATEERQDSQLRPDLEFFD
jgi:antitoxin VapB